MSSLKTVAFNIALLRVLALFLYVDAQCTFLCAQTPSLDHSFEIDQIRFEGNESLSDDILKDAIASKQSPGGFSKFLFRTFGEHLGSKPEYFDPVTFEDDQRRLKDFYYSRGYYDASVHGDAHVDSTHWRVDLQFAIQEGQRSFIDSLVYNGFDSLSIEQREIIFRDPLIQKGKPYEEEKASAEIARILNLLSNSGYPTAKYDGEHSGAFKSSATKNFFLRFGFVVGRQFTFDGATVHVDPPRADLGDDLVVRQLDFQSGDIYSLERRRTSERNLNRIGLFESARVDNLPISDSSSSTAVPIDIFLRPRPRNELSPEILVSDENNDLNLGLGLGYANRNFLGDGRTFNARIRARTQSIRQLLGGYSFRDTVFVGAADIEFQLLQPYFFTRTLSGSWTSTIAAEKQRLYILSILRNRIGISNQFATYTNGFLDWTLERVSPELLDARAVLREEDQPQFNSILTFTLQRDKTNDIFSPTDGFFNSISLEESGILPKLVPGIRRSLPFTQYYKATLLGRWYNDLTTSRFNILALKIKTGYQDKYGESRAQPVSIPLNRRFFSGGSGSVRGWRARELGAMADELTGFGGNFILEGSAEMRVNHFRGFGTLGFIKMDNIWGVYFLDFGNNWSDISDFTAKEIAVAAGFGFRYETLFGPFRVDFGFRVYDPKGAPGRTTLFQKQLWNETLANGVLHLGIGHAF